jgi:hypothetical protein
MTVHEPRKSVGVLPASAVQDKPRLFGALEEAFPVNFEGLARTRPTQPEPDGLLVLGRSWTVPPGSIPSLTLLSDGEIPFEPATDVDFMEDRSVARPLRGRRLRGHVALAGDRPGEGDSVLAHATDQPVWWSCAGPRWAQVSTTSPEELGDGELLRDMLRPGRFMGLVPLLHFLHEVGGELNWDEQPLQASFVVDDPNLHWTSYGYLDYSRLVAHADRHGYHVGLATVPLDGWLANRRAVALVRDNPNALSLLVHGNDHTSQELGRLLHEREAEVALAQALRRVRAFERRAGVTVQRVMVPPHEACSMTALKAMCRLGFDAACIARRYPGRAHEPPPAPTDWPLMKWHATDLIDGALPVLPRYLIHRPRDELVLRALLGQPLILFGHHWDFADGLDLFAETAGYVNGLGDVRWGSAGWIAGRCFLSRREGTTLVVRMHARRIALEIPPDVSLLRVRTPCSWGEPSRLQAQGNGNGLPPSAGARVGSEELPVRGGTRVTLELTPQRTIDPDGVGRHGSVLRPAGRRALVEARDRTLPLRQRVRRAARRSQVARAGTR